MHDKGVTVIIIGGGAGGPTLGSTPSVAGKSHKKKGCPCMISIPLKALISGSEDGEAMTPESGDTVTLQNVMGVVKSIEGEIAHVEVQSVNGEEATYAEEAGGREEMLDLAMMADENSAGD